MSSVGWSASELNCHELVRTSTGASKVLNNDLGLGGERDLVADIDSLGMTLVGLRWMEEWSMG